MVTDLDGKAVGNTSLRDMMTKSGIANLVKNNQSITFGDQKVSPDKLKNITYNDTGITRAILPIKSDGSVDFSLLDKYRKFEAQLALSPRMSTTQKKMLWQENMACMMYSRLMEVLMSINSEYSW